MKNILFLILIPLFFFSCESWETLVAPSCERDFAFSIPVRLSPALDTCKTKSVDMKYVLLPVGGGDNFDLLDFSLDPQKKNYPKDKFKADAGFVFFVTD